MFDVTGRRVARLGEGIFPTGTHELTWDASNLTSGSYFIKLDMGEFRDVKEVRLVK